MVAQNSTNAHEPGFSEGAAAAVQTPVCTEGFQPNTRLATQMALHTGLQ
jgi:hypothetical protein